MAPLAIDEWLSCDLVLLLVLLLLRPWTGVCARLRGTLPLPTATRAHNRRSRSDMRRGRVARGMLSQCMEKPTGPIGFFFPELFKLVSRRVKNQDWLGMVQVGFQEGRKPERSRPAS